VVSAVHECVLADRTRPVIGSDANRREDAVQIDMPFEPDPDGQAPDSVAPAPDTDVEPSAASAPCPDDGPVGVLTGRPWQARPQVEPEVIDVMRRELPLDFSVSDRLLTLLAIRGLTDGRALEGFFYPTVDQIPDPFLLKEMGTAVERTFAAVRAGETVAVHGDFDVDGITGCAVLTELFRSLRLDENQVQLLPAFIPSMIRSRSVRFWLIPDSISK